MIEYSVIWPSKIPCRQKCSTQQKGNGTVDILPVEEAIRCSAKLWLCLVVILNSSWSPSCISNFQHAREARVFSCNWSNNHLTAHALNIAEFHSILAVARLKRAPVICWRKWRSSGWSWVSNAVSLFSPWYCVQNEPQDPSIYQRI